MSNFPTSLPAQTTTYATGDTINAANQNNPNAEINAIGAKVGIDGSAVTTSHDYKFGEVTGTDKAVGKTATQTLTNKTLTSPKIQTNVLDLYGNILLDIGAYASAVNYLKLLNANTGANPLLLATGSDTNINIDIQAKGTGSVILNKATIGTLTGILRADTGVVSVDSTAVTTAGTQTLTNKTLTTPAIASIKGTLTTDTDGATVTFDKNTSDFHNVVLGGNRTLALSNMAAGDRIVIRLTQDATGSRTVTWFTTIKWAGGSAPTLTTTINKADMFGFLCTSAGNYDGFVIGQNI